MSKRGIVFAIIVLALATVLPMAASPDLDSATGTPIPTMATVTPTPIIVKPLDSSGRYESEDMEEVRRALLDVLDVLDELYPYAETYAQVSGQEVPPKVNRQLIQGLTHQELHIAREAFGGKEEYEAFVDNVRALKSLVLTPENEPSVGDKGLGPSLSSSTTSSDPPLTSLVIIPAPTPVMSGGKGVPRSASAAWRSAPPSPTRPAPG